MTDESIVRLDYVIFKDVKENYFCNSPLEVKIKFDPQFPINVNDWVGLFKVGWTSIEENICRKNVPKQTFNRMEWSFTFETEALPEDEDEFFHLCYITQDEQLAGISIPFQFLMSDFEIIENYHPFDSGELCTKIKEMELENSKLKDEMESLQKENEMLSKKVDTLTDSCTSVENQQSLPTAQALPTENDPFAFMDEYYNEHSEDLERGAPTSDVIRPIGFENLFPNRWVTYENNPNTAYPEPTWFPNPYANYMPGPNRPPNY